MKSISNKEILTKISELSDHLDKMGDFKSSDDMAQIMYRLAHCGHCGEDETLSAQLDRRDKEKANGNWYPARGEEPVRGASGGRFLWCYQPSTGRHAYYDMQTDMILSDKEAQREFPAHRG